MVQIQWEMWERFCISIVQHTQTHIFGVSVCFSRERCRWWYCCYHCEFVRVAHPRLLFSMFIFRFFSLLFSFTSTCLSFDSRFYYDYYPLCLLCALRLLLSFEWNILLPAASFAGTITKSTHRPTLFLSLFIIKIISIIPSVIHSHATIQFDLDVSLILSDPHQIHVNKEYVKTIQDVAESKGAYNAENFQSILFSIWLTRDSLCRKYLHIVGKEERKS